MGARDMKLVEPEPMEPVPNQSVVTTEGGYRPGRGRVEPVPIGFECEYEYGCRPGSLSLGNTLCPL